MTTATFPPSDRPMIFDTQAADVRPGRRYGIRAVLDWMVRGDSRYRQMRHLSRLEPHLLEDIGLTRAQVLDELRRGGW